MSQTAERTATLRTHRNANKIINQAALRYLDASADAWSYLTGTP